MSKLTQAVETRVAKHCPVAQAREELDPDSARDFDAWMSGEEVEIRGVVRRMTDKEMYAALQALNYRVGAQTLGRHRRGGGECGCRA